MSFMFCFFSKCARLGVIMLAFFKHFLLDVRRLMKTAFLSFVDDESRPSRWKLRTFCAHPDTHRVPLSGKLKKKLL